MKNFLDKLTRAIDRTISGSLLKQFLFFLFITAIVFTLPFALRVIFFSNPDDDAQSKFWNSILNFIDTDGYENMDLFERILVLITNLGGIIIFSGILVAILTNFISQRIDNFNNGEIFYSFNNHIVIIGYDNICDELIAQLAVDNDLVLQTSEDVNAVRHEIFNNLPEELKKKVYVVSGNRIMRDDVEKLRIHKCRQLFLFGGMNEDSRDSTNIECLGLITDILKAEGRSNLKCHVFFKHHSTFAVFERQEISGIRETIDFLPFNFYDMWAQKIFVKNTYNNGEINYKPLDYKIITADSQTRVHLIILGMSNMGISLGLQAAQLCHFPNFVTKKIKTRITFIDKDADSLMQSLKMRLRTLFDETDYMYRSYKENVSYDSRETSSCKKYTDIEFEFIKAHFQDDEVQNFMEQSACDKNSCLTVAVALHDPSASLAAALYLPPALFDSDASVLVRQVHSHSIISMLSEERESDIYRKYKNLRPFGMLNKCYEITEADEILPMMVKYTYDKTKFDEEYTIKDFDEDAIRENWKSNWKNHENMPALKASNRYAANFIPIKQRSLDIKEGVELNVSQINLAARVEHNRWVMEKLLVGFRAPTPEEAEEIGKDRSKREYYKAKFVHQDIKGYQELGEDIMNIDVKIYDINISRALPYMLKFLADKRIK